MLSRLSTTISAHLVFLVVVWALGIIVMGFAARNGNGPNAIAAFFLIGMFVIIPLIFHIAPAAIIRTAVYVFGGIFNARFAIAIAIFLACLLLWAAVSSKTGPGDLSFALPGYGKAVLVLTYILSWLAAHRYLPEIRSALKNRQ